MRFNLSLITATVSLILTVAGCQIAEESNGCELRLTTIAEMESALLQGGESVDATARGSLMAAYADFANHCHDAQETPEFLFRRADLLRSAGQFQEAMSQLRDIHDHYKEFDKRPICAFLVGFIAEVELNDREQAKKTYEQVIELHPKSAAADWARQSILNLKVELD